MTSNQVCGYWAPLETLNCHLAVTLRLFIVTLGVFCNQIVCFCFHLFIFSESLCPLKNVCETLWWSFSFILVAVLTRHFILWWFYYPFIALCNRFGSVRIKIQNSCDQTSAGIVLWKPDASISKHLPNSSRTSRALHLCVAQCLHPLLWPQDGGWSDRGVLVSVIVVRVPGCWPLGRNRKPPLVTAPWKCTQSSSQVL